MDDTFEGQSYCQGTSFNDHPGSCFTVWRGTFLVSWSLSPFYSITEASERNSANNNKTAILLGNHTAVIYFLIRL